MLAGMLVVEYEVDAFVVLVRVTTLAELPGETDDVEEFAGIYVDKVVMGAVELVVAFVFKAEVMHEQTSPASTFAARAVTRPQALVAQSRALITIEFDIAGWHCGVISKTSKQLQQATGEDIGL